MAENDMRVGDGYCPKREDKIHCVHWWDGEECCNCKAPAMTEEARIANGMESGDD